MKRAQNHPAVKILIVFILLVTGAGALPSAPTWASTTTITENFTGDAPGWNILPNASLTSGNIDPVGSGWLRLTSNAQGQAGAAFYDTAFNSDAVFDIEFDYATWGGNGADGLTFFMIDGSATPTAPGGSGGYLGYGGDVTYPHIDGAYFAVAFDEYNVSPAQANIGIYAPGNYSKSPSFSVLSSNIPASRDVPKHVHIIFHNNFISVWLAGVEVIADINLNATLPGTVKFGFSAGSGNDTNYHEIRNAAIRMIRYNGLLRVTPSGFSTWPCGGSWDTACTLQTALDYAADGTEIWAAAGTYYPGRTGLRTATFLLPTGVSVYGGFAGIETSRDERDPIAHPTILSGDLDQGGETDIADNAYHVVTSIGTDNTTILDGFTITGGNANDTSFIEKGGGMYNLSGSPTLANLYFYANSAVMRGGGLYNEGGDPTLTNVLFEKNRSAYGGGMANYLDGNASLQNVTFTNNEVHLGGGGLCNLQSSPVLINITFNANQATYGGGMADYNFSSPILTNAVFLNNHALIMGGGILNEQSSPTLTNATIYGNTASQFDGGIYNNFHSATQLINSILWANTWGSNLQIVDEASGQNNTTIVYSDIEGGFGDPTTFASNHNIAVDPLFVDAAGGNLNLQYGSPAIDAGLNDAVTGISTDRDGNPRIAIFTISLIPTVDLGAYEVQGIKTFLPILVK